MRSNKLLWPLCYPLLATVLAVYSASASTQDLYKVEVIVFERSEVPSGNGERWPRDIELVYPADTQIPAEPSASSASEPEPGLDTAGHAAYQLLPSEKLSLNNRKSALNRDYRLRPIFHQAWLQPLTGPNQSHPVQIAGGETFGEHRELGGTIEVSVNKFIHLDAHLWLAEFERNTGQLPELWPPLPSPTKPELVNHFAFDQNPEPKNRDSHSSAGLGNGLNGELEISPGTNPIPGQTRDGDFTGQTTAMAEATLEPFLVKEIVTLNQSRRMRTGEVHYLDHPRLGVLVQVEKYQQP